MPDEDHCNCTWRIDGNGTTRIPSRCCPEHGLN
jgi:hypothetical protein